MASSVPRRHREVVRLWRRREAVLLWRRMPGLWVALGLVLGVAVLEGHQMGPADLLFLGIITVRVLVIGMLWGSRELAGCRSWCARTRAGRMMSLTLTLTMASKSLTLTLMKLMQAQQEEQAIGHHMMVAGLPGK